MSFQNLSNNNYIFYYILRLIDWERERERPLFFRNYINIGLGKKSFYKLVKRPFPINIFVKNDQN